MSPRLGDLLVGSIVLLCHGCWRGIAQQVSFIEVTSPESGDVFQAGDVVRVEWEAPPDSSYFDIYLLNDASVVGDSFCDDGCLAPNGFLEVTLPTDLETGSEYTFLVGDRVSIVSMFGESEAFQIVAVATVTSSTEDEVDEGGTDTDTDTDEDEDEDGADGEDAIAEDAGGGGDSDGFRWGVVIGAVAAGLGLAAILVAVALGCCRKRRGKDKGSVNEQGSGKAGAHKDDSGGPTGPGVSGDVLASSSGQSDGSASVAALAEMGALSPVHEENAEVVTKNPMISAMANGAQFPSSTGGGTARFNSSGGSSKFPSLGGGSSNEGEESTRGPEDEDEEGGGMFADADVVAVRAAAAAHGVGKKGSASIKRSGSSGTPRWDGGWIRSPAWNRQKTAAPALVAAQQSRSPVAASKGEDKSSEATANSEPEAATPAPAEDWMVSTRESFSSRKNAEASAFTQSMRADSIGAARGEQMERAGVRLASGATREEKKAEESETADAVTTATSGMRAELQPRLALSPTSPQSVDGISAKLFGQAEVVARELPVVMGHGIVPEPECEVPKPALSSGRPGAEKKQGDYSWLPSSSSRSIDSIRLVSPTGDSGASQAKTPRNSNTPPPSVGGGPMSPVKAPSTLPADPTQDQWKIGSAWRDASEVGQDSAARAERRDVSSLYLPPKSQGVPARRGMLVTPRAGAGKGFSVTTPTSATRPSRIAAGSPSRGPRVSQVVEVFEGLTPRGKNGSTPGLTTPGRSLATARASTPGSAGPGRSARVPTSPLKVESYAAPSLVTPGTGRGGPTPGALTPGAVGWSTPVATLDRPPGEDAAKDAVAKEEAQDQDPANVSTAAADAAPEKLSRGGETPGDEVGRGCSTPLATPDRSPKHSAPDSGRGGATPECTTDPNASRAAKTGDYRSPTYEGHFVWQLDSPAGVDGLPSPMDSSDINVLAIGKKRGRIIPAILGASNTPITDGTPVLTPSTTGNKAPSHSVVSSGDSSAGGVAAAWEMDPSFGASQVVAFVADAQAEAAAEAQALVVEAQAEAAKEEAAEEKARAEMEMGAKNRDGARASNPAPTAGAAAAASDAGGAEPPRGTGDVTPKAQSQAAITAPALASIAARLSPISAARSTALQARLPMVGATSSPITALGPAPMATAGVDGKGVTNTLEARAPATTVSKTQHREPATVAAARAAESQATQAASAAVAAANAAAEADAAAEDAVAEAKEASMEAERAAKEAAAAKAAKQRETEIAAKFVEESRLLAGRQVGNVPAAEENTTASSQAAHGPAGMGEASDAARGEGEGVGGVIYHSTDAAWREVYNDAEADTSDDDTDGDEIIDVGEEKDWSTVTSVVTAAHSGAPIGSVVTEMPTETATATATATATGENQYEQRAKNGTDGKEGLATHTAEEQQDSDSLQGEASGVDALVANAMALADAATDDAGGLYEGAENTANAAERDQECASPSVRDVVSSGVFGSTKSGSNWIDGEETGGANAERDAEEIQALVAEALALVKEANEDA